MALAQKQMMFRAPRVQRAGVPVARPAGLGAVGARPRYVARAVETATETRFIPRWNEVFETNRANKLETVMPEDAAAAIATGEWVLIDVRRPDQFAVASPKGAVNVPLYRKIDMAGGFDAKKVLRSIMYAFNGVDPIEPNDDFIAQVAKAAEGGKGLIFACEAGGTMKPTVNFPQGKASRSLQACYKAMEEGGHSQVKHLDRGIYGWYQANLEFTGNYKPEIGRFPSAAQEPMLKQAQAGRGYEIRPNDKQ